MNTRIILILLIWLPNFLFAQADLVATKDYVYTQEGSVFRGKILEYKQGEYVRIQLKSGDVVQVEDSKIKKIVQKEVAKYKFKNRSFYYHIQAGVNGGMTANDDFVLGFSFENNFGLQYNRKLGFGIGVGADRYFGGKDVTFIPVSLNVRGYLLPQSRTPYYSLNVGYGFASLLSHDRYIKAKGGLMVHPSLGIRFGTKQGAFTLDFGVKMQNATLTRNPDEIVRQWWGRRWLKKVEDIRYLRTGVRLGWLF